MQAQPIPLKMIDMTAEERIDQNLITALHTELLPSTMIQTAEYKPHFHVKVKDLAVYLSANMRGEPLGKNSQLFCRAYSIYVD